MRSYLELGSYCWQMQCCLHFPLMAEIHNLLRTRKKWPIMYFTECLMFKASRCWIDSTIVSSVALFCSLNCWKLSLNTLSKIVMKHAFVSDRDIDILAISTVLDAGNAISDRLTAQLVASLLSSRKQAKSWLCICSYWILNRYYFGGFGKILNIVVLFCWCEICCT